MIAKAYNLQRILLAYKQGGLTAAGIECSQQGLNPVPWSANHFVEPGQEHPVVIYDASYNAELPFASRPMVSHITNYNISYQVADGLDFYNVSFNLGLRPGDHFDLAEIMSNVAAIHDANQ